jgi:hypothetical protein
MHYNVYGQISSLDVLASHQIHPNIHSSMSNFHQLYIYNSYIGYIGMYRLHTLI